MNVHSLVRSSLLALVLLLAGCRSDSPAPSGPPFGAGNVPPGVRDLVVPDRYALNAPYPNPFNPVTAIDFAIPTESPVLLVAQNPLGDVVATLYADNNAAAGYHVVEWDASEGGAYNLKSGLYFITMYAPGFSASRTVKFKY